MYLGNAKYWVFKTLKLTLLSGGGIACVSVVVAVTVLMLSRCSALDLNEGCPLIKNRSCARARPAHGDRFQERGTLHLSIWLTPVSAEFRLLESHEAVIAAPGECTHHTICARSSHPRRVHKCWQPKSLPDLEYKW